MSNRIKGKKIGDLVEVFNYLRVPLSGKEREKIEKIYPYYGAQNIVDYVDNFLFDGEYILVAEDGENLRSKNQNICNLVNGKFWVNNHAHILCANNENNTKYLYYNFNKINFEPYVTGSAQPKLNKENLLNIVTHVHEIEDQKKIASVLSVLDTKIELNNRINAELEAMAKTLYDYWFVQFDFPVVTSSGVEKPYKSSGGKMVWNEELKREIPEGWEVKKINSIIEVKDGTHDSPKPKSEGYRLITSKNLQVSGLDFDNANLISEEDYLSIIKRSNVETGDILFSMIGNIGTVYKIEEKEINFAIKNVALYKTSQKEEYKNYVYMFLKSIDMERYMKNVISGSIQKFIGLNSLRETPILSNKALIKKYNEITFSIFEKLENLKLENKQLTELRDWLLPMLMNGQVTVKEESELSMAAKAKVN